MWICNKVSNSDYNLFINKQAQNESGNIIISILFVFILYKVYIYIFILFLANVSSRIPIKINIDNAKIMIRINLIWNIVAERLGCIS